MRIAHFYDGIYLNGGVSSYILALSEIQLREGHKIFYFEEINTAGPLGSIPTTVVTDNDELFRLCAANQIDILHMHAALEKLPPLNLHVVFTVHQHWPHCMSGGLYLKRRDRPCPRTYNLLGCVIGHAMDHCGSIRPARFFENLARTRSFKKILPNVTVISVGQFLRRRMIKAGYDPSKVNFVPNFTVFDDPPERKQLPDKAQFLFLGRLEPSKGVAWLLKSFSLMSNVAILNIAGSGADEPRLRALVRELGLERRVNFLGWVSNDTRLRLLCESTALVVPSTWHETFGLVVIEAAAQGCAVIVSDAGELPFLVEHGETGMVVPVGNSRALAAALDDLAGNQSKAIFMGAANRKLCETKYNPVTHLAKIDEVYRLARTSI